MTDRLLNCPFCGGEAKEWVEFEGYTDGYGCHDERNLHHCGCTRCGVLFSAYWDKDFPRRMWNTRKPMDRIVEALENQSHTWKPSSKEWWKPSNTTISLKKAIEIVKNGGKDE